MKTRKAYFFTNEKLAGFLATHHFQNLDRVFGIGGGGDFAFNLLALQSPKKIVLCDNNPLAISAAQKKIDLMKQTSYETFLRFLSSVELQEIKKSKRYYPDSFKAAVHTHEYLAYLSSQETYLSLQKAISKIEMVQADFTTELSKQTEDFDLIYLSNLLETKLCREPDRVLDVCRTHLSQQGKILLASQDTPKSIQRFLAKNLFHEVTSERHTFSTFQTILGHYSYSFYLCEPS